jgi:hypothetical protein
MLPHFTPYHSPNVYRAEFLGELKIPLLNELILYTLMGVSSSWRAYEQDADRRRQGLAFKHTLNLSLDKQKNMSIIILKIFNLGRSYYEILCSAYVPYWHDLRRDSLH